MSKSWVALEVYRNLGWRRYKIGDTREVWSSLDKLQGTYEKLGEVLTWRIVPCEAPADPPTKAPEPGKKAKKVNPRSAPTLPPKRLCHDCGKPTTNYRCDECWAKIREKEESDFHDFVGEEYRVLF